MFNFQYILTLPQHTTSCHGEDATVAIPVAHPIKSIHVTHALLAIRNADAHAISPAQRSPAQILFGHCRKITQRIWNELNAFDAI